MVNKNHTGLRIEVAENFSKKLIGWMNRKPVVDEGLMLFSCNSIHTFFMRFNIDVVFLNARNQVVKILPCFTPWKVIPPVLRAINVLELPAGKAQEHSIAVGDTLTLTPLTKQAHASLSPHEEAEMRSAFSGTGYAQGPSAPSAD